MAISYQVTKISDQHYRFFEDNVIMDLLVGTTGALLIDTGFGYGNLPALIAGITDKPLTVVNTHGHPDHSCGNWQFPEVYISSLDFETARMYDNPAARSAALPPEKPDDFLEAYLTAPTGTMLPCEPGHVFDLGDQQIEAVALPGHTAGSTGYLNRTTRELYVGDAMNSALFLFQTGISQPLSVYRRTLETALALPADTLWLGHEPAGREKESSIALYRACAQEVDFDRCYPCGEMLGTQDVRLWIIPEMQSRVNPENPVGSVYEKGLVREPGFASIFIAKEQLN